MIDRPPEAVCHSVDLHLDPAEMPTLLTAGPYAVVRHQLAAGVPSYKPTKRQLTTVARVGAVVPLSLPDVRFCIARIIANTPFDDC